MNVPFHNLLPPDTMKKGEVYVGGNCDLFCQLTGAEGPDILYFGDHIYGDVVRSKKTNGKDHFNLIVST